VGGHEGREGLGSKVAEAPIDRVQVTERRIGQGRIVQGRTPLEALGGLPPDFAWDGGDRRTRLSYVHRTAGDVEIYFVVNDRERWEEVDALFRVRGVRPELWDPSSGEIVRPLGFRADGARTRCTVSTSATMVRI